MYQFSIITHNMGEIQIDDFKESFYMDFGYWKKSQYEAHWLTASRALAERREVSFIQSMHAPESASFYQIWAAYPQDGAVVFQEQILMLEKMERPFNIQEPHFNALPYESHSESGEKISEWRTIIQ